MCADQLNDDDIQMIHPAPKARLHLAPWTVGPALMIKNQVYVSLHGRMVVLLQKSVKCL